MSLVVKASVLNTSQTRKFLSGIILGTWKVVFGKKSMLRRDVTTYKITYHSVVYSFGLNADFIPIGSETDPNRVVSFQSFSQRRHQSDTIFQNFFGVAFIDLIVVVAELSTSTEYNGPIVFRRNYVRVRTMVVKCIDPRCFNLRNKDSGFMLIHIVY